MDSTEAKGLWAIIEKVHKKRQVERHPPVSYTTDLDVTAEVDNRLCRDALQKCLTFYERAAAVRHPPQLPFNALPEVEEFWQELHNITNQNNEKGAKHIRELRDYLFADGEALDQDSWDEDYLGYHMTLNQPTKMFLEFVHFFCGYYGTEDKPVLYHTLEQHRRTDIPIRLQINAVLKHIIQLGADVNVDYDKLYYDYPEMFYLYEDDHVDFLKILLENGADQYNYPFLELVLSIGYARVEWNDTFSLLLRDDFHPDINYIEDDVHRPYDKENKISEYVREDYVPHSQSLLMMAIEGIYRDNDNKNPSIKKFRLRAKIFRDLLRAGAHPFLNDIKKYTDKDGYVVKKEAVYNPKKPTAKDTLLVHASPISFFQYPARPEPERFRSFTVTIPFRMTKRLEEQTTKTCLNQALVRAFTIPLSAITYNSGAADGDADGAAGGVPHPQSLLISAEIDIVVRAHNRKKKDEIIEQMTAFEEECKRSFSNYLNSDDFRIGKAKIVTEPLLAGLPAERKTRNRDAFMLLWEYNQYAAAWRKFNTWKAAQLNMEYRHTVDYTAQPFSTFWPLLLTLNRKLVPEEIRHNILHKYDLSDDLTDKNNIQQMRHYLWETNKGFAIKEFAQRHYLRTQTDLDFAAEYDVRHDRLGNVSRALQEIQRMWHEDERLECYGRITQWAGRAIERRRGFEWPSIEDIKRRLGFHAKEHKRKEELTKIMRELQGRVDTLAETNIADLMRVPLEA